MTVQRYRYRMTGPTTDMVDLASKSDSTLAAVGQTQGQVIDLDVDDGSIDDLDEALASYGYVRIAGPGVTGVPGDVAEFVRRTGDSMSSGANIVFSGGGNATGLPAVPAGDTHAVSLAYLNARIVSGRIFRETVLINEQLLSGASGGILQAALFYLAANLTATDTFILTDGTTTETFTAVAGAPGAFQFQVGGSAAVTQGNLVAAININSTLWSALATTQLDTYFSALPAAQFVVYRTAVSTAADRAYGTLFSAASIHMVEFGTGLQDYQPSAGVESSLPATNPGAKRFGFGRTEANLTAVETHFVVEGNSQYTWDDDDQLWRLTGGTSSGTSVLTWGAGDVSTTTTERFLFPGSSDSLAKVIPMSFNVPKNGSMRYMHVRHNTLSADTIDFTYTLRVNGVDTALAVVLSADAQFNYDSSTSVVVSMGDQIDIVVTKASAIATSKPYDITVAIEFTS